MLTVTTSWDDGDALDERLAKLLDKYGVKGTFYITKDFRPVRLSEEAIVSIGRNHELGAHTLTHADLTKLNKEEKEKEIKGSKEWIESVIQKKAPMFCYPFGRYDADACAAVRDAGFAGARTVEYGSVSLGSDPFAMPTTLQVYPFPFRKRGASSFYWSKLFQPLLQRGPTMRKLGVPIVAFRSWETLACAAFDVAREKGGVFHLWGHSWEIDQYGMWDSLERVLKYVGGRADCRYATNGYIIQKP